MRYIQDRPARNHLGYTQDSNLTNPKPNPNHNLNPLTSTVTLVRSLIRTSQTHHPCKSPLFAFIIISVGRLLICIVLRIAKTDRSCRTVPRITSALFFVCNKLCGRPPQYAPPPASWPLTFWPWKWCPNHVWRQQTSDAHHRLMPPITVISYELGYFT